MRKKLDLIYIMIVFGILLLLSVGTFMKNGTLENEQTVKRPEIVENNFINPDFLNELEAYVTANFGFRTMFINMNSQISKDIFHTSGVDSVVLGNQGYLYYADTVNDYLGIISLNEREQFNIIHSLELIQENVQSKNAKFLFLIAPNKNSLYDYMPYNYVKVSEKGNADKILEQLKNVNTIDLFSLFHNQSEELYHKLDSHWNNKGAYLVFQEMMENLSKETDKYADVSVERRKDFAGDLYKMLNPSGKEKDWNYYYSLDNQYHYLTRTRSVEQSYIETENTREDGSLLMFRDSFGNALLPFLANVYKNAVFDKNIPYDLRKMDAYQADTVVIEIAERNLSLLQENMPLFFAPLRQNVEEDAHDLRISSDILNIQENGDALVEKILIEQKEDYTCIKGSLALGQCEQKDKIYLKTDDGIYELTPQKFDGNEYGFCGYFTQEIDLSKAHIEVLGVKR